MKKMLLLFFFQSLIVFSFAQTSNPAPVTIKTGPDFTTTGITGFTQLLGIRNHYYYLMKYFPGMNGKVPVRILKFDSSLHMVSETEIPLKCGKNEKAIFVNEISFGGIAYIVYGNMNEDTRNISLSAYPFNFEKIALDSPVHLCSYLYPKLKYYMPGSSSNLSVQAYAHTAIEGMRNTPTIGIKIQAANDKFEDPPCNFLISPDSNTMTLVVPIDQKSPDESRKLLISVFNRTLSPVWSQTITLPFSVGSYIISEKVNNNNDVFLLFGNKMSSEDRKAYKQNGNSEDEKNVYSLCSITGKGTNSQVKTLPGWKNEVLEIYLNMTKENELEGIGLLKNNDELEGITTFLIDQSTLEQKYAAQDVSIASLYKSTGLNEKEKDREKNFAIDYFIETPDGIYVTAEQTVVVTVYETGGTYQGPVDSKMESDNVIIIKLGKDITPQWASTLMKQQLQEGNSFGSYYPFCRNDEIHILFNDNPDNFNIQKPADLKSFDKQNADLILVDFAPDGSQQKYDIMKEPDSKFMAYRIFPVNDSTYFLALSAKSMFGPTLKNAMLLKIKPK